MQMNSVECVKFCLVNIFFDIVKFNATCTVKWLSLKCLFSLDKLYPL